MNKRRLALLSTLAIATILASGVAMLVLRTTAAGPSPTPNSKPTLFTYTAKWICNLPSQGNVNPNDAEGIGLVPGEYKTDINVHNPGPGNITILKKFVQSVPEAPSLPKPTNTAFVQTFTGPDVAFFITCDEITSLLNIPALHAAKGFVILQANVSNLDVVAEYSSQAFDTPTECPTPAPPGLTSVNCVEGLTLDVQKITPVAVTTSICVPGSSISITPSTLNVPVGSTGTATIVVTNTGCVPFTECFTVNGPSGVISSIAPVCLALPAGPGTTGIATVTVVCNAPGTFPVTINAISTNPPLVQTATLIVIC